MELITRSRNIEFQSKEFLQEATQGRIVIPIDIGGLAQYLGLRIKFGSFDADQEALSSFDISSNTLILHNDLSPKLSSTNIVRYNYTVAYWIAHINLHEPILSKLSQENRGSFFVGASGVYCFQGRVTNADNEREAKHFVSCLLMPREWLVDAFEEKIGYCGPISESEIYNKVSTNPRMRTRVLELKSELTQSGCVEWYLSPIAMNFGVPVKACINRARRIGILCLNKQNVNEEFF